MMQKHNVLVLCHGNRYRSPLAHVVLATYRHLEVRSAGFRRDGLRAAKPIRSFAESLDLDLDDHRSSKITRATVTWANTILYMDDGNRRNLDAFIAEHGVALRLYLSRHRTEINCLGAYLRPAHSRIPDPAFVPHTSPKFRQIVRNVVTASHNFAQSLQHR